MKRINLIVICCILSLSLAACGNSDPAASNTETITQNTDLEVQNTVEAESSIQEKAEQEFSNIEIECKTGTIRICSGEAFSFTDQSGKAAEYSVLDDTLYIEDQGADELTLILPDDYSYDTVTLSVDKGHVYSDYSFNVNQFNLDLDDGEVSLEQIQVSESCLTQVKRGSAFLNGTFAGTIDAACREGHLQIQTPGKQTDFNYSLKMTAGNLQVGEDGYHGAADKMIDNGAVNTMNLSCTFGDIAVIFEA